MKQIKRDFETINKQWLLNAFPEQRELIQVTEITNQHSFQVLLDQLNSEFITGQN